MNTQGSGSKETIVPSVAFFDGTDDVVQKGIRIARELGQDTAIINQYVIPEGFATVTESSITVTNQSGASLVCKYISQLETLSSLTSLDSLDNEFKYEYNTTVKNKRVLYGDNSKYGIISIATGSKMEATPEDLALEDSGVAPKVWCTADLRQEGTPLFRFLKINGESGSLWFNNMIQGAKWQTLPIRYTERSGVGVEKVLFNSQQENAKWNNEFNTTMGEAAAFGAGAAGVLSSGGDVGKIIGSTVGTASAIAALELRQRQFDVNRETEKSQFNFRTSVVAPQINFPQSESIRDFAGNGMVVYRMRPTDADLAREDKILNMYGYAIEGDPVSLNDFKSMKYFNYVEASDVKITTNLAVPRHIIQIAQEQISAGIRVWNVNPNDSYYTVDNRPS